MWVQRRIAHKLQKKHFIKSAKTIHVGMPSTKTKETSYNLHSNGFTDYLHSNGFTDYLYCNGFTDYLYCNGFTDYLHTTD